MSRSISDIHSALKIFNSNKLDSYQGKLLFMGLTYDLIQNKELFPKNSDLKKFIGTIYENNFLNKEVFREYLYLSRTLLASRVTKVILIEEYDKLLKMASDLSTYLPKSNIEEKGTKSKHSLDSDINEWITFLRDKSL